MIKKYPQVFPTELSSKKTLSCKERIMSKDKYTCIHAYFCAISRGYYVQYPLNNFAVIGQNVCHLSFLFTESRDVHFSNIYFIWQWVWKTMHYTMVHSDKAASWGMEITIPNYIVNRSKWNCLTTRTESQSSDCNILTAKNIQQVRLDDKTRSNDELIMLCVECWILQRCRNK